MPVPAVDQATLAALESTLEPAPRALIVREVAELLAMYDPPKASIEVHTKGCVEALLDMPPDILREGLRRLKIERCYPSAPMPGDFRKACQEALSERIKAVAKARVAALRYRPPSKPKARPTEDQIERVAEMVASVRVQNRDNPLKAIPGQTPQHVETAEALRLVKAQTAGFRLPAEDDPEVRKWMGAA